MMRLFKSASFIVLFATLLSSCSKDNGIDTQTDPPDKLLVVTQSNSNFYAYGVQPGKTLPVMSVLWSTNAPVFTKSEKQLVAFGGLDSFSGASWADTTLAFQKPRTESLFTINPETGQRQSGVVLHASPNFYVTDGSMQENTYARDQLQTTVSQIYNGTVYLIQILHKSQQVTRSLIAADMKTGQFLWKMPLLETDVSQSASSERKLSFNGNQGVVALQKKSFLFDLKAGKEQKEYATGHLQIESNGDLYALTTNTLIVLDEKTAAKKWEFRSENEQPLQYTFSKDKVFVTCNGVVTVLDAQNGSKKWTFSDVRNSSVIPSQITDNTIYLVDKKGIVNAIDTETGAARWASKPLVSDLMSISKIVSKSDKVFVQTRPDFITVLDTATGTETSDYSVWGADFGSIHDFNVYTKSELAL